MKKMFRSSKMRFVVRNESVLHFENFKYGRNVKTATVDHANDLFDI